MTANQVPAAGTPLFAVRDGVPRFNTPNTQDVFQKPKEQRYYPTLQANSLVGTFTGQTSLIGGVLWLEIDWLNNYVWHLAFQANRFTTNPVKSWVRATDVRSKTAEQEQEEKDAENDAQKQKTTDAVIDLLNDDVVPASGSSTGNQTVLYMVLALMFVVAIWYFTRQNVGNSRR